MWPTDLLARSALAARVGEQLRGRASGWALWMLVILRSESWAWVSCAVPGGIPEHLHIKPAADCADWAGLVWKKKVISDVWGSAAFVCWHFKVCLTWLFVIPWAWTCFSPWFGRVLRHWALGNRPLSDASVALLCRSSPQNREWDHRHVGSPEHEPVCTGWGFFFLDNKGNGIWTQDVLGTEQINALKFVYPNNKQIPLSFSQSLVLSRDYV